MKKILYLLLVMPMLLLAGCKDDDDVPNVDLSIALDNVVVKENTIYIVEGTTLSVTGVTCQGIGSNAILTSVTYYWDEVRNPPMVISPFAFNIDPSVMPVGHHTLGLYINVAQEGKSMGYIAMSIDVIVVESEEDLPDGLKPGTAEILSPGRTAEKNE